MLYCVLYHACVISSYSSPTYWKDLLSHFLATVRHQLLLSLMLVSARSTVVSVFPSEDDTTFSLLQFRPIANVASWAVLMSSGLQVQGHKNIVPTTPPENKIPPEEPAYSILHVCALHWLLCGIWSGVCGMVTDMGVTQPCKSRASLSPSASYCFCGSWQQWWCGGGHGTSLPLCPESPVLLSSQSVACRLPRGITVQFTGFSALPRSHGAFP